MASLIFDSFLDDIMRGNIVVAADSFKCVLVTSSYSPNKKTHTKRSDVTNEVTGTGYSAGGAAATFTVTKDAANDRQEVELGAVSWGSATITAAGAVYYKARGGASSADELVAYIDFGGNIVSTDGTFALTASTVRIRNG